MYGGVYFLNITVPELFCFLSLMQGRVVEKVDKSMRWINLYPVDSVIS